MQEHAHAVGVEVELLGNLLVGEPVEPAMAKDLCLLLRQLGQCGTQLLGQLGGLRLLLRQGLSADRLGNLAQRLATITATVTISHEIECPGRRQTS